MLDERVRSVLERLDREDTEERERGLPAAERSRQVARTTGRFLFALVAPQTDCEVLEIGGSRGYSTIWLAAGVRTFGGRVLSLESDPGKVEPGALIVADNVLSHPDPLAQYSAARQADPTLESLTVPLDRGLELSVVLR